MDFLIFWHHLVAYPRKKNVIFLFCFVFFFLFSFGWGWQLPSLTFLTLSPPQEQIWEAWHQAGPTARAWNNHRWGPGVVPFKIKWNKRNLSGADFHGFHFIFPESQWVTPHCWSMDENRALLQREDGVGWCGMVTVHSSWTRGQKQPRRSTRKWRRY